MEKKEIKQRVSQLQDKEALLQLLNDIVKDELSSDHVFSFSMKQLSYYCNPNNVHGRYHHFSIPKKNGKLRRISAPSKGLSHILHYVNVILKDATIADAIGYLVTKANINNVLFAQLLR